MFITQITNYPIKSIQGINQQQADVTPLGLKNDRTFMLVDENGLFITQRKNPQMALISLAPLGNNLMLNAPDMPSLLIDTALFDSTPIQVEIWKDQCKAFPAEDRVNQWFSKFLGYSARLVSYPFKEPRSVDQNYSQTGDIVSFADGFPLLIISEASLDDLNKRLESPVSMTNFRPNIVVSGSLPYAEDNWKQIQIGSVVFDAVKLCSRCVLTTIDPKTGIKNQQGEPLKTLSSYRRSEAGVCFGMNLIPRTHGIIQCQQELKVLS